MTGSPEFLSLSEVMRVHALSLEQHGGSDGVRDIGLVESDQRLTRPHRRQIKFSSTDSTMLMTIMETTGK